MTNEFILEDRLQKIRSVLSKYNEENFYISFSGGKDSTVLHYLIDMALPNNKIPRVYTNTGIEFTDIVNFVKDFALHDDRFYIISPTKNIRKMLEEVGYPFKSKKHSAYVERYQKQGYTTSVKQYLGIREDKEPWSAYNTCPGILRYQFESDIGLNISSKCCDELKKKPMKEWCKKNHKVYNINGIRRGEGGNRIKADCLAFRQGKLFSFQPLAPITTDWEDWFIKTYGIKLCKLYYSPFNFVRTGCKGCPFARYLQNELDILKDVLPSEYNQCEIIWKPVYDEYRRIGYRLRKENK